MKAYVVEMRYKLNEIGTYTVIAENMESAIAKVRAIDKNEIMSARHSNSTVIL